MRGRMHGLNVLIEKLSDTHGSNCSSLGYRSIGLNVPDVIITDPNLLNRGAMARDESRHASSMLGSESCPTGSIIMANRGRPSAYVATRLARSATSVSDLKSSRLVTCSVRSSDDSRVYANLSGLASTPVAVTIRCKNARGVSLETPPVGPPTVRSRALRCSTTFFMNATKCSARRMLPGTASLITSFDRTELSSATSSDAPPSSPCSTSPCTRFWYSLRSRDASEALTRFISPESRPRDLVACSRLLACIETENASMQTESMLCASSNTTIDSASSSFETILATFGSSMYW
mmetsp:Transcript_27410/g.65174  ORF Transcript_27410/g.65174 Transcript_27410/m.65174 type:complete len:292 (-) Transcript_27410:1086-1961(-)